MAQDMPDPHEAPQQPNAGDVVPDGKDWTWVLDRPCPECGLDSRRIEPSSVGALLRDNSSGWRSVLARPEAWVRARPAPGVWSALEYGCHVRDVCRLYDERLRLMLTQDGPCYPNWDQDASAVAARYYAQDPGQVSAELIEAAHILASSFDRVEGDQWQRTGFRSDGASFTVATFARYLVHDPVHHLHDVLSASQIPAGPRRSPLTGTA